MERKITFVIANQTEELNARLLDAANQNLCIASAGYATNADQGIALVKKHQPDILVLDMELENSSGVTLLEGIQDIQAKPVIIVTGPKADRELCNQFSDLGVDYFLIRPIATDIIVERVIACAAVLSQRNK